MSNYFRNPNVVADWAPSPGIWGDLRHWQHKQSLGEAILLWEDFVNWNTSTTNSTSHQNGWTVVADNGPVLEQIDDPDVQAGELGVVLMTGADADNDELYLTNSVAGTAFKIDDATLKLAFECRIKKSAVTDAGLTFFAGFASLGAAVAGTLVADAGTLIASKSFLGFSQDDADGDAVKAVAQKAAATQQTPLAANIAIVADTWVRLGLVYEPSRGHNCVRWYVNGVEQVLTTKYTSAGIIAATFPDDVCVNPLIGFLHEGVAHEKAEIDWLVAGQLLC